MTLSAIDRLSNDIDRLTFDEQLMLLERLAARIRTRTQHASATPGSLEAMANDPAIQREIREINTAFAVFEGDGLERI